METQFGLGLFGLEPRFRSPSEIGGKLNLGPWILELHMFYVIIKHILSDIKVSLHSG